MQKTFQQISLYGRLLGASFYYEPSDSRIAGVLDFFSQPTWTEEWEIPLEEKACEKITALINQGLTQDLTEQYQNLFIGPNELVAPPWGSVYLDPECVIFGNSLLALRDFLKRHQIAFQAPHLLVEFLSQHLLTWVPHFLNKLANVENHPFYQGLAQLTLITLDDWKQKLSLSVPDVRFYR